MQVGLTLPEAGLMPLLAGKGSCPKDCGHHLKAEKGKEMVSPTEPRGSQPCGHLDFSSVGLILDLRTPEPGDKFALF